MRRLYFVRHGLSELGKQGLWAGSTDTPLAPEGHQQARAAGQGARGLGIGLIISSPLSRARQTAELIASEIDYPIENIVDNDLVIERSFGELEATPWNPDFDMDSVPSAETSASVLTRAEAFWEYAKTVDADTVLVVSHGAFGRALRHVIHQEIPFDNTGRFENAVVVQLV